MKWGKKFIGELRKEIQEPRDRRFIWPSLIEILESPVHVVFWAVEYSKNEKELMIDFFKENLDEVEFKEWNYEDWKEPKKFENLHNKAERNFEAEMDFNFVWKYGPDENMTEWESGYYPKTPRLSYEKHISILSLDPTEAARQFIQSDIKRELERRIKTPIINAKIRRINLSDDERVNYIKQANNFASLNEVDKCKLISHFFYLLGFETFPLEVLKGFHQFKEFQSKTHVDVIAYYYPLNLIYLIEEKNRFSKTTFYKLFTSDLERLSDYIDLSKNLLKKYVIIGSISPGIEIPETIDLINIRQQDFLRYYRRMVATYPESNYYLSLLPKMYKVLKLTP